MSVERTMGLIHSGSHLKTAPGRRRLGAAAIDLGIAVMVHMPLALYWMFSKQDGPIGWPWFLGFLALEIAFVMASGSPEILGASIGKRLLGLGVRSEAGEALRSGRGALRWLMKYFPIAGILAVDAVLDGPDWSGQNRPLLSFSNALGGVLFFIALIDIAFVFGSSRRALHDVLTHSVVVDVRGMGAASAEAGATRGAVSMKRTTLGMRAKAGGVDLFFWWLVHIAAMIVGVTCGAETSTMYTIALSIPIVYSIADIWSASPGKLIFKLRILDQDGSPAPRPRLLVRWLVKYALLFSGPMAMMLVVASGRMNEPSILLPVTTLAGLIEMLCVASLLTARGPQRQTFYDMISRTAVFRMPT